MGMSLDNGCRSLTQAEDASCINRKATQELQAAGNDLAGVTEFSLAAR
jgi:hypothetical protein